eukprot:2824981-Prorocentrum_lima.AAC.1
MQAGEETFVMKRTVELLEQQQQRSQSVPYALKSACEVYRSSGRQQAMDIRMLKGQNHHARE